MANSNGKKGGSLKGGGPKSRGGLLGQKPRPKKAEGPVYVRDDAPRRNQPRAAEKVLPQFNKRLGEFRIDRLSHDGRGVASLEGKTLFIAGAMVNETVTARLVEEHSRYIDARVDEILLPSPERVSPPCPHFIQCGGCQLQYMPPAQQVAMKQEAVLQQLKRWGGVEPKRVLPPITGSDQDYRCRARLGVWYEDDGIVRLGFRQHYSKVITPVEDCWVLAPGLNQLLLPLQGWLSGLSARQAVTHVELVEGGAERAMILRHTKPLAAADRASLAQLGHDYGVQVWLEPNGNRGLTDCDGNPCDPRLHYEVAGLRLAYHPQDFTQVNPCINQRMVEQALELLALRSEDRVLDLFCGIGNFTLPIAQACAQVIGIEAVDSMVARGRENAAALQLDNAQFIAANLADMTHTQLQRLGGPIDALLLDPPRDGAKDIVTSIQRWVADKQLSPRRIVYVSCNPATLARDAALLAEAGYALDAVGVLDMFPHTSHVESMALFLLK